MSEPASDGAAQDAGDRGRTIALALVAGALMFLIVAAAVFFATRSGDDAAVTDTTTTTATTTIAVTTTIPPTTTTSTTTTTTSTTTTTTTTTIAFDPEQFQIAIWPWFDSDLRYAEASDAALGFASDYLGMVEPILGEFQAGDALSGEVEVRSFEGAEPITVSVRQLADMTWWVLGAQSPNIIVDSPSAGSVLASPLAVSGRSVSFDGTIDVEIRVDGELLAVLESFVTGGVSPGAPDNFSGTFEWVPPPSGHGAIMFVSRSPDDGRVVDATVVRQTFG